MIFGWNSSPSFSSMDFAHFWSCSIGYEHKFSMNHEHFYQRKYSHFISHRIVFLLVAFNFRFSLFRLYKKTNRKLGLVWMSFRMETYLSFIHFDITRIATGLQLLEDMLRHRACHHVFFLNSGNSDTPAMRGELGARYFSCCPTRRSLQTVLTTDLSDFYSFFLFGTLSFRKCSTSTLFL